MCEPLIGKKENLLKLMLRITDEKASFGEGYNKGYKIGIDRAFREFKSAKKFYKRYRDDIDKLFKNERKIYDEWFKFIELKIGTDSPIRQIKVMYVYYNDWLLDYCLEM